MLVIDASAVAELLLAGSRASAVDRQIAGTSLDLHAPHVLDLEVMSSLRRAAASGVGGRERCELAVSLLRSMPIERHAHEPLLSRVWQMRHNFTPYDAAYVTLAEVLGVPLLTTDGRLARAVATHSSASVLLAK